MSIQHVFIIGSKGIPSQYGGFETFVDRLTEYEEMTPYEQLQDSSDEKNSKRIMYHVSCRTTYEEEPYLYHSAECISVKTPSLGAAAAIVYDLLSIKMVIDYVKKNKIENPYVYILASRIGPFIKKYVRKIHSLGGKVFLNPDGFEWKRGKWSGPVKAYWKMSTKQMVKASDYIICDSEYIRTYICENYKTENVYYIPYGADTDIELSAKTREKYNRWLETNRLEEGKYFLTVSRLVPENNFETMIREYMQAKTDMPFALITTVNDDMKKTLDDTLHYTTDDRIRFLPVVYDKELLALIRQGAVGYFHGHEVGGTNPTLLEAMASGTSVLALDVPFNIEVCGRDDERGAYYWSKEQGDLSGLIDSVIADTDREEVSAKANDRIARIYSWDRINRAYRGVFLYDEKGM